MFRAIWRRPAEATRGQHSHDPSFEKAAAKLVENAVDATTGRRRNVVLVLMESTGAVFAMKEKGSGTAKKEDPLAMELDEHLTPSLHLLLKTSSSGIFV